MSPFEWALGKHWLSSRHVVCQNYFYDACRNTRTLPHIFRGTHYWYICISLPFRDIEMAQAVKIFPRGRKVSVANTMFVDNLARQRGKLSAPMISISSSGIFRLNWQLKCVLLITPSVLSLIQEFPHKRHHNTTRDRMECQAWFYSTKYGEIPVSAEANRR